MKTTSTIQQLKRGIFVASTATGLACLAACGTTPAPEADNAPEAEAAAKPEESQKIAKTSKSTPKKTAKSTPKKQATPSKPSTPTPSSDPPAPSEPSPTPVVAKTPSSGKTHVVQSGETLWDVARKYNTGVERSVLTERVGEIKKLNKLPSELAEEGAELKLPSSFGEAAPESPPTATSTGGGDAKTHLVKSGETLWDVARQHYPDADRTVLVEKVSEIKKLNNLPSELAPAGETLKLP